VLAKTVAKTLATPLAKLGAIDGQPRDPSGARPVKHSFAIAGHRTSISLEAAFWEALRAAAASEGMSLAQLVGEIDAGRGEAGLSSAVRVYMLAYAQRGGRRALNEEEPAD
jgi:predicted DNA-binding ribbon-helix-helix protein